MFMVKKKSFLIRFDLIFFFLVLMDTVEVNVNYIIVKA